MIDKTKYYSVLARQMREVHALKVEMIDKLVNDFKIDRASAEDIYHMIWFRVSSMGQNQKEEMEAL